MLTPLDMHAHIKPDIAPSELHHLGACVAAMTRSLTEYAEVEQRDDPSVAWGVGCHPSLAKPSEASPATRSKPPYPQPPPSAKSAWTEARKYRSTRNRTCSTA